MESTTSNLLCFLVFLSVVTKGVVGQCSVSTLTTMQIPVPQKQEWRVNITNTCDCTVYNLNLLCPNFEPRGKINSLIILKIDKDHCLINNGSPIYPRQSFSFTYASPSPVAFALSDFTQACS